MSDRVSFSSPGGQIHYEDSRDHFENGLLRLLGLNQASFAAWLGDSERSAEGGLLERLRDGFRAGHGGLDSGFRAGAVATGPLGTRGTVWHAQIAENPRFGVARSDDGAWGWLVREEGGTWSFETTPPVYEESYFEGGSAGAGGYGQYAAQSGWRLEKAARQLRELQTITGVTKGRALDLGSGYGYFRAALRDAAFEHEGIEISKHARQVAESLFGFATLSGTLEDHEAKLDGRYDLITLWDVIEHVADPVALLTRVAACLAPGGAVAIKTPNLDCPEADVFGPDYHSLKREHLVYFTPKSLEQAARLAGLHTTRVCSTSHLLAGFVGSERTREWEESGRGADITAYFHR